MKITGQNVEKTGRSAILSAPKDLQITNDTIGTILFGNQISTNRDERVFAMSLLPGVTIDQPLVLDTANLEITIRNTRSAILRLDQGTPIIELVAVKLGSISINAQEQDAA